ncbi:MAG: LTA synthase family protein, partial [Pseudolabrys sp.]
MLSVASALLSRLAPTEAISRRDAFALAVITVVHLTALVVMAATELDLATKATFLLAWALLNFFWLGLLRRPAIAGFLSLAMIIALILLSQFKYDKLMMTVNFVD